MNIRCTLTLAAVLVASPAVLQAQSQAGRKAHLDPAAARVRDRLYELRDSLLPVQAIIARLPRDLPAQSDAVLRSRATQLADRCSRATPPVTPADSAVRSFPAAAGGGSERRAEVLGSLRALNEALAHCASEFTNLARPERATALKANGVGEAERARLAIRRYEGALRDYFPPVLGIGYEPSLVGAGYSPR